MVLFALVARTNDGLPLSATTDHETSRTVLESKKIRQSDGEKIWEISDRCSFYTGSHWLYLISALGVSFISLCEETYPTVLAFCFLDELQREFISSYDARRVKNINRPYALIEFNRVVQKTKQRYNNTRALKPKSNLSNMSQEVKLRPPHRLTIDDLGPISDVRQDEPSLNNRHAFRPAAAQKLPSLGMVGKMIRILSIVCGSYHILRIVTIVSSGPVIFKDDPGEVLTALAAFFGAATSSFLQSHFLYTLTSLKIMKALLSGFLVTFCCGVLFVNGWLEIYLLYVNLGICWLTSVGIIFRRRVEAKLPDYTV